MEQIKFNELGLHENVLKAIEHIGFEHPSQIQEKSIPIILEGHDLIGQAQTGTGKTVAFGAPVISTLMGKEEEKNKKIKTLILSPTRELALQISEELERLCKFSRMSILTVYGGDSIERQIRALKKGVDVVVGTPGRILDHLKRKTINFKDIEFLVVDEADEMLNMGFIEDLENIMKTTNENKQTMLFSATMPPTIKKLAENYMKDDYKHVAIKKKSLTVDRIKQCYFKVRNKNKTEALFRLLDIDKPERAIIFCRTKRGVDELVEAMQSCGYNVEGMHGDMRQNHRTNTLKKFKSSIINYLIATDVAARGIDVENITHVFNYDLPQDVESYVHRIGRTGRANKSGTAYSLITQKEMSMIREIEKVTKSKIQCENLPSVEDIIEAKYNNLAQDIRENLEKENHKKFVSLCEKLGEEFNIVDVAATLMSMTLEKQMNYEYNTDTSIQEEDMIRLFINLGKKDGLGAKKLLNFIRENCKIDMSQIGDIDILEKFSFMDCTLAVGEKVINKCVGKKYNNKRKVNIEIANKRK